jgi:hypothetical protein
VAQATLDKMKQAVEKLDGEGGPPERSPARARPCQSRQATATCSEKGASGTAAGVAVHQDG